MATLPDPMTLRAAETAKAIDTGEKGDLVRASPRRGIHFVAANEYLRTIRDGDLSPAKFERHFAYAKVVQTYRLYRWRGRVISCE
jgi:hypothetical protein